MDDKIVISERDILIEMLELYRDLPSLWDPNHELYNNREARHQAYESLLECYVRFDKKASLGDVKRKLENMRTAYKREKRKVKKSVNNCNRSTVHVPTLWYYPYLRFLDEDMDHTDRLSLKVENCNDSDNGSDEPERKKPKTSSKSDAHQLVKKQMDLIDMTRSFLDTSTGEGESSADTFGRSISSQLKELPKIQRCLAEKLIGEVMFYAKMDQLNVDTVVYLNEEQ